MIFEPMGTKTRAKKGARIVAAMVGALSLSACGSEAEESGAAENSAATFTNGDTGEAMVPLAHFDFPNGSTVDFFEIDEGDVVYAISGRGMTEVPGRDLVGLRLSATEIYERMTSQPAPQALIEADVRVREVEAARTNSPRPRNLRDDVTTAAPQRVEASLASPAAGVARSQQAVRSYDCSDQTDPTVWFTCNFCAPNDDLNDWDYTWLWRTGSGNIVKDDIYRMNDTVWLYSGASILHSVRYRVWYEDFKYPINGYIANWDYRTWGRVNWSTDWDFRSVTQDGAGDGYHWCNYGI
jgi:hypothetical protein